VASRGLSRTTIYALSFALLASICWFDYLTGYELGLFALYFVPIGLVARFGTRRAGLLFAVAAALGWYASDVLDQHPYSKAYLVYWETFMRFASFAITAWALSRVRSEMRAQEDLLSVVSHDLRAPLGAVEGQARILRGRAPDEWVAARADAILRASHRMDGMIQDLVDGARHRAGKLRLELRTFDLHPYLTDLLRRLEGALEVERVDLRVDPAAGLRVRADPDRLDRILANLISNALKYSPPDARVRVSADLRAGWLVLTVADEGPGIAPADLPHLFERYYRGRGVPEKAGIGLGLHSCRMLAEAHGGHVRVEPSSGRGATFVVVLPEAPAGPGDRGGGKGRGRG
jgi:signal transduction histidine kinase